MSSAPALPQRNQNIQSNLNAIPSSNSNPFLAQEASSSSSSSSSTPSDHLLLLLLFDPLFESDPSPFLLSLLASSDNQPQSQTSNQKSNPISRLSFPEKAKRFRNALLTSSSNNHLDLLYWLLDSKSPARRFLSNLESADAASTPSTSNQQSSPPPIDFKNILDSEGNGPMVLAASSGHVEAVRMLVRAGADVDERDPCDWTPLMWAVNSSNLPLVSFLLSHGADLEARSSSGTNCETFILSSSDQTPTTSHNGFSKSFLTSLEGVQSSGSRNLNSKTPQSPHSSDRELIAEMIYEFGQVSKEKNQKQSQKPKIGSLGSSSSLSSNSSVPGRGSLAALYQRGTSLNSTSNPPSPSPNSNFNSLSTSPTKKSNFLEGNNDNSSPFPKSPQNTLARKHSRSSSYNPNLNPKFDSLSSSGSKKSHNRHASLSIPSSPNPSNTNFGSRRLIGRNEKVLLAEKELKERELSESRRRALLDISITLEVDYSNLIGLPPITDENANLGGGGGKPSNRSRDPGRSNKDNDRSRRKLFSHQKAVHSGLASGSGSSEVGANPLSLEFRFNLSRPLFSQLIVISSNDLPVLLDEIITNIKPVRAPWINRTCPANTLFLAARWCCLVKDADLLEDLLLGAVDRIQEIIYEKSKDLTYLAFWLSNCTILLHYLKRDRVMNIGDGRYDEEDEDETLEVEDEINEDEEGNPIGRSSISSDATKNARTSRNNPKEDEEDPLNADLSLSLDDCRLFLLDLINELYVFVVRDVERRIDKVLDAALLDHDAIPGFGETKFEGEWNLIKSLAGSVKAATTSSNSGSLSSSPSGGSRRPISQIFNRNSLAVSNEKGNESSFASLRSTSSSPQKNNSPNMIGHGLPDSDSLNRPSGGDNLSRLRETSYDATAADLLSRPSPRTITTLLTSTLQTLQLYEINPSIIIQTFSQIFFWLSCELFNRILKNRKYLSRSRAMQIRLNISSLEDWSRNYAIPLGVIIGHLLPVKHLISWLQCQSSLKDFDGLIITLQGLKELTPKQMRRVVKDYRYEVGEERMSGECEQYLEQLELDWERRNEVNRKIEEEKEREMEMKRKERKERRKAEKQSTKPTTSISSNHHRSGTATQNGYNHDSTPSSPSEEYDEADQSNRTALIDEEFEDEEGNGSDEDDDVSSTNSEALPHSERIARSSQRVIDSLFTSGKSLNDYVPPWTTSGSSKGAALKDNDRNGLLNSRDMLPFALPSDTEALIVTPGDSFGMGRGHWTGTGTPTLRSQAGSLISDDGASNDDDDRSVNSSISNLEDDDLDASVPPSPSPSNRTRDRDRESVISKQSSVNSETSSKCSNLYPQGKGFKSGSNWQPVPILPEGLLESLTDKFKENFIFRNNQSRLERLNAGLLSPSVAAPSPNFNEIDGFAQQRKFKAQESGHKSRAEYFGYEDSNDDETEEEQYYDEDDYRQRTEKMTLNKNQTRHSTFSAAPIKLVVPNRNQYQQHHSNINQSQVRYAEPNFQEQSHRRNQSEDVELDTPTGLEPRGLSELKGRGMKSSSSEKTLKGGA